MKECDTFYLRWPRPCRGNLCRLVPFLLPNAERREDPLQQIFGDVASQHGAKAGPGSLQLVGRELWLGLLGQEGGCDLEALSSGAQGLVLAG